MRADKKARLEKAGWKIGSAQEFLGLSDSEASLVELKLRLAQLLRERRIALNWTQVECAKHLGSSQSRVAKLEAADPTVSLDLMFRSAFAIGATKKDLARTIASDSVKPRSAKSGTAVR